METLKKNINWTQNTYDRLFICLREKIATWTVLHKLTKKLKLKNSLSQVKTFIEEDREKLEKIFQQLNEEEDTVLKKWYQSLIPKAILLLFPLVAFGFTFLKVNADKSILDLLSFVAVGGLLVFGGIFLNYLLSKER